MTTTATIIEGPRYAEEESVLRRTPMVHSIAVNYAIETHAGKTPGLEWLSTHEGMMATGRLFQEQGISYQSIGGPSRVLTALVAEYLGML